MHNEERIWELISVKLTGEITADESAELARIITDSPDLEKIIQSVGTLWQSSALPPGDDAAKAIEKIIRRFSSNPDTGFEDH